MSRILTFGGIALTIAASVGLYQVKYQVQEMERELAGMKREVVRDRAEIQVLGAEWSFLNQPDRIQDLAGRYLDLSPVVPGQMASIESLPPRGAEGAEAAAAHVAEAAPATATARKTGARAPAAPAPAAARRPAGTEIAARPIARPPATPLPVVPAAAHVIPAAPVGAPLYGSDAAAGGPAFGDVE